MDDIQCPVCQAGGNVTETCRRCRADLKELQQLRREENALHDRIYVAISTGDFPSAIRSLRSALAIRETPTHRRLLQTLLTMK